MDQLLDSLIQALSRVMAEAHNFVRYVESLLDSFLNNLSLLLAEAPGQVKQIELFLHKSSQFFSSLIADSLSVLPPVASQLYIPMLGGLVLTILLLLLALMHSRRVNARASKEFGREITFEDISAETANSAVTTNADTTASQVEPRWLTTQNAADNPNENFSAQTNGFTFFRRKSDTMDRAAIQISDTSSDEAAYRSTNASTEIGDDTFLAGLEQEMLATRQLYLDGTISKEVYVSETRALYQKARSRMT